MSGTPHAADHGGGAHAEKWNEHEAIEHIQHAAEGVKHWAEHDWPRINTEINRIMQLFFESATEDMQSEAEPDRNAVQNQLEEANSAARTAQESFNRDKDRLEQDLTQIRASLAEQEQKLQRLTDDVKLVPGKITEAIQHTNKILSSVNIISDLANQKSNTYLSLTTQYKVAGTNIGKMVELVKKTKTKDKSLKEMLAGLPVAEDLIEYIHKITIITRYCAKLEEDLANIQEQEITEVNQITHEHNGLNLVTKSVGGVIDALLNAGEYHELDEVKTKLNDARAKAKELGELTAKETILVKREARKVAYDELERQKRIKTDNDQTLALINQYKSLLTEAKNAVAGNEDAKKRIFRKNWNLDKLIPMLEKEESEIVNLISVLTGLTTALEAITTYADDIKSKALEIKTPLMEVNQLLTNSGNP